MAKKLKAPKKITSSERCQRGSQRARACRINPVTKVVTCGTEENSNPEVMVVLPTGKDGNWERKRVPVRYVLPSEEKKGKIVNTSPCVPKDMSGRIENIAKHAKIQERKAGNDPNRVWTRSKSLSELGKMRARKQNRDKKNRFTKGWKEKWDPKEWQDYKKKMQSGSSEG